MAWTGLPELNFPIAYKHDDGEHPGGGYCPDLTGRGDLERWTEILLQQHAAFTNLADKARSSLAESGTVLGHHPANGPESGIRGHDLSGLWKRFNKADGAGDLDADQVGLVSRLHARDVSTHEAGL